MSADQALLHDNSLVQYGDSGSFLVNYTLTNKYQASWAALSEEKVSERRSK